THQMHHLSSQQLKKKKFQLKTNALHCRNTHTHAHTHIRKHRHAHAHTHTRTQRTLKQQANVAEQKVWPQCCGHENKSDYSTNAAERAICYPPFSPFVRLPLSLSLFLSTFSLCFCIHLLSSSSLSFHPSLSLSLPLSPSLSDFLSLCLSVCLFVFIFFC